MEWNESTGSREITFDIVWDWLEDWSRKGVPGLENEKGEKENGLKGREGEQGSTETERYLNEWMNEKKNFLLIGT